MKDRRTDAELVAAHTGGDRRALAAIYDRYADSLYDTAAAMLGDRHEAEDLTHDVFVVASRQLAQLRQPDRLRAWLFAILRHEVFRRTKRRQRVRATDLTVSGAGEIVAPDDALADAAGVERDELARFVRDAAAGLGQRDQLLLELSARQGLAGADLADALGVTQQQCHVLLHRMRERVQRSIGALTVARYGRADCADLQALLVGWDGVLTETMRKRVAGHVDGCDTCGENRRRLAVVPLLSAAPAFAAPVALRARVLRDAATNDESSNPPDGPHRFDAEGFPRAASSRRRMAAVAALLATAVVLFGGAWLAIAAADEPTAEIPVVESVASSTVTTDTSSPVVEPVVQTVPETDVAGTAEPTDSTTSSTSTSSVPPTVPPPAPGQLVVSATRIDLGAASTSAPLLLTNTGGQRLDWALVGEPGPLIWSASSGALEPGGIVELQVGIDRGDLAEGDVARAVQLVSSAQGGAIVEVLASVERTPAVAVVRSVTNLRCPYTRGATVAVRVDDESSISGVDLTWTGPGGSGSTVMTTSDGQGWVGVVVPAPVDGTWTWVATARDVRGNTAAVSAPLIVDNCS